MLYVPHGSLGFSNRDANYYSTRPGSGAGTSVTPGTGGYGSWATIRTALAYDAYGFRIVFNNGSTNSANRHILSNIGIDPAGGTSFTTIVPDLCAAQPSPYHLLSGAVGAASYYFPVFIPAGATVGAQSYSNSANTLQVAIELYQSPVCPASTRVGSVAKAYGVSTTNGTAVTPGTVSEGSWTSIGTTTMAHWYWQANIMVEVSDTSWNGNIGHLDISVGDGANYNIIAQDIAFGTYASPQNYGSLHAYFATERFVPSGSTIYARAQNSGTLDTNYEVIVYGVS